MKKIEQVAIATVTDQGVMVQTIVALSEGEAWELRGSMKNKTREWVKLPPLPEDEESK